MSTPGIRALDIAGQREALALDGAGHDAHGDAGRAVAHRDFIAAQVGGSQEQQLLAQRVNEVLPSGDVLYCLHGASSDDNGCASLSESTE